MTTTPFTTVRTASAVLSAPEAGQDGERTLSGRALPWGEYAWGNTSRGPMNIASTRGSIDVDASPRVLIQRDHDAAQLIGKVTSLEDREDGLYAVFEIAATPAGDEALTLARAGILDGLSVGTRVSEATEADDGSILVSAETLHEISLTARPAHDGARLEMSRPQLEDHMPDMTTTDKAPEKSAEVATELQKAEQAGPVPAAPAPHLTGTIVRSAADFTPGDYLSAYVKSQVSGGRDGAALAEITRAVSDQITTDVPGIVPTPILGPVIDLRYNKRPLWNSLAQRTMPLAGASFTRPKVTVHTNVALQATEKAELASRAMKITADTVNKKTYAGTLDVSFQVVDFTDPGIMNILVNDFADSYVLQTEASVAASFATAVANNSPFTATTDDPASVIKAFYDAAAAVFTSSGLFPDTVWCSVDQWAVLGSLVDPDGRQLFPTLAPSNAAGGTMTITNFSGSPLGARLVVAPALAAGTLVVGVSQMGEVYERVRGLIQALNVTQWGLDLAYGGVIADYFVDTGSFQPITLTAPTPPAEQSATKSTK